MGGPVLSVELNFRKSRLEDLGDFAVMPAGEATGGSIGKSLRRNQSLYTSWSARTAMRYLSLTGIKTENIVVMHIISWIGLD